MLLTDMSVSNTSIRPPRYLAAAVAAAAAATSSQPTSSSSASASVLLSQWHVSLCRLLFDCDALVWQGLHTGSQLRALNTAAQLLIAAMAVSHWRFYTDAPVSQQQQQQPQPQQPPQQQQQQQASTEQPELTDVLRLVRLSGRLLQRCSASATWLLCARLPLMWSITQRCGGRTRHSLGKQLQQRQTRKSTCIAPSPSYPPDAPSLSAAASICGQETRCRSST